MKALPIVLVAIALSTPALAQGAQQNGPNAQDVIARQIGQLYLQNTQLTLQVSVMQRQIETLKKQCGAPCEEKPQAKPETPAGQPEPETPDAPKKP